MPDIEDDLVTLLPALLRTLDALAFFARHFHPPDYEAVLEAVGTPETALHDTRPRLDAWPDTIADLRDALATASDAALAGFADLRTAPDSPDGVRAVFRALRNLPRAEEALFPLARDILPVSRYFLTPAARDDAAIHIRLGEAGDTGGITHIDNDRGSRGGYSLYIPETYTPDRPSPLVMALHGGSGNGRAFLWSWLRDARAHGAILIAPTATGPTWSLMGDDTDTPNLARILAGIRARYRIDPTRLLLTGMSDGGTFCYVSGLLPDSPFTHLAPCAASFHPMLAQMADPARLRGLPIHLTHGALDWMFPVRVARDAQAALNRAGAAVTYREIDDLSHTYPRDLNPDLLTWLKTTPPGLVPALP